ncbi:hypothetical protein CKM354_000292200 [Cercospora kikuchii]|uniref:rRNA-processing protein EFG1 n=1 Tax=Cercospora kikuchii TaxID=84275 RepID=A0A9P3F9S0_9PEZI|nr:uncharacterized protein CKM354_000292200 [Cercospora kikuchii]GIZ39541.1 hypothetical protein CKM354_000292200 [Cercospora kikuchii]
MATKRPAPDPAPASRPSYKRHRTNNSQSHKPLPANLGSKSFKKAHTVNDLKSNIRSLRRLLTGPKAAALPATVRAEKERALRTAEQDLAREQYAKKRNDIIARWHKIRFFDRQKAERRLKKARKALRDDEDNEELREKVKERENEVNYAMYYPLDQDYVPLFPTRRKKEDEQDATVEQPGGEIERQGDGEMWEVVKRCAEAGTLKDLREGRLKNGETEVSRENKTSKSELSHTSHGTSKQKSQQTAEDMDDGEAPEEDSDNESGGDFFE